VLELNNLELVDKKGKYSQIIISHIKTKLCSYKQQDINKNKFDFGKFVSLEETIKLLKEQMI